MLSGFLFTVCLISSLLLILFIYIQDDQGEGMGGIFSGSSGSPFGGSGANVLQKITATLVVMFFVSAFAFAFVNKKPKIVEDTSNAGSWLSQEGISVNKTAEEKQLLKELEKSGLADMKTEKTNEGVKLVLEDIQFVQNSSQFVEGQDEKLRQIGSVLSSQKRKVKIIGHTADIGNPRGEVYLSSTRALAVADYFIKNNYLTKESIVTEGKGSTVPVETNATAEGKEKNRRVEIVLIDN